MKIVSNLLRNINGTKIICVIGLLIMAHQVELHANTQERSSVTSSSEVKLLESKADLDAGKKLYTTNCVVCHQANGKGLATFPSLVDDEWISGKKPEQVFKSISEGNVAKGMVPYKAMLSEKQITQLTSYVLLALPKQ